MDLCTRDGFMGVWSCFMEYKDSWKKTTLQENNAIHDVEAPLRKPLHFDGFYSLFLYRRWYRCYTSLVEFSVDNGNVERKKPVLLCGLADSWPARKKWSLDQLLLDYGDTIFRISPRRINMKFKDYVSSMKLQHDEDPLYIFDEKFGEVAPGLLKYYTCLIYFTRTFLMS